MKIGSFSVPYSAVTFQLLIIRYLNMTVTSCFLAKPGMKFELVASLPVQFYVHLLWQFLTEGKPHIVQRLISKLVHKPYSTV